MQTASAYQPHSLPSSFPLPRNRGVPDTSIAADVPPSPESSTEKKPEQSSSPSNVSLREGEAQKPKPAESASTTTKPEQKAEQKPRRKLRARKAAIKMTPLAVEQLHRLVSQPDPRMVRVGVKNKGCSGLAYNLEYVEKPGTFDEVVEQDGVSILIDSKALFSIIGSEMDWQEDKLNQRFVFNNPNISECTTRILVLHDANSAQRSHADAANPSWSDTYGIFCCIGSFVHWTALNGGFLIIVLGHFAAISQGIMPTRFAGISDRQCDACFERDDSGCDDYIDR